MGVKLWQEGLGQHRGVSLHVLWYEGSEVMLPPFARERRFRGGLSNNHFLWKVSKAVPLQHLCSCAWPTLDKTDSAKKDPFSPLLGVASLFDALHPLPLYLPWSDQCRLTTTAEALSTLLFDARRSTVTGSTNRAYSTTPRDHMTICTNLCTSAYEKSFTDTHEGMHVTKHVSWTLYWLATVRIFMSNSYGCHHNTKESSVFDHSHASMVL